MWWVDYRKVLIPKFDFYAWQGFYLRRVVVFEGARTEADIIETQGARSGADITWWRQS